MKQTAILRNLNVPSLELSEQCFDEINLLTDQLYFNCINKQRHQASSLKFMFEDERLMISITDSICNTIQVFLLILCKNNIFYLE